MKIKDFKNKIKEETYNIPNIKDKVRIYAKQNNFNFNISCNKPIISKKLLFRLCSSLCLLIFCSIIFITISKPFNNVMIPIDESIPSSTYIDSNSNFDYENATTDSSLPGSSPNFSILLIDSNNSFIPFSTDQYLNNNTKLIALLNNKNISSLVEWSTSNENIATITDNGVLNVINNGVIEIIATYENMSCSITVNVKK